MSINGSVSHGDGDKIPEDLEEDYFPPNFKEYMLKEQLKWSRHTRVYCQRSYFVWVFWSEQVRQIEPSLSLDNWAGFNPNDCAISKVEYNIRHALELLIRLSSFTMVGSSVVQFWAPAKTLEGRIRLTTKYQPFALGPTWSTIERQQICEYRMKMCSSEYNYCFYADAEGGEEQLGLPGRVFRNQSPESTPDVKYYSTQEYPQLDLALRCKIRGSWAVPVFEHSSRTARTCVGVLEMASLSTWDNYDWQTGTIVGYLDDILKELGLQCFNGYPACEKESREKGLAQALAFEELKMVLSLVCKTHELPLAMSWVPCSACNGLRRCEVSSAGVEFCLRRDRYLDEFLKAGKRSHLRKGLVAGRARSSPNVLYCSDISQLSLYDYPLVPYTRLCKLSGWFTIYLQNVYTGNEIYVLEFFLSARSKNEENILATLSYILGTIGEKFTTFRLASGQSLGEQMPVEVICFQNNQRFQSIQRIQATRDFSISSIPSSMQSSASVANARPGFHDENMGTINAEYDLKFDFNLPFDSDSDSDASSIQSSTIVADTRPGFQNANMVIIIAKYASIETVFELSLPCRLVELQQEVTKGLMLEAGTYHAFYEDEEDRTVFIGCDEDLQTCVYDSMSQGNTPRVVLLEQKEPATNLNPTN